MSENCEIGGGRHVVLRRSLVDSTARFRHNGGRGGAVPTIDPDFWIRPEILRATHSWIDAALLEDRAKDDITSRVLLGSDSRLATATVTAGEDGVLCGADPAIEVFRRLDPAVEVSVTHGDGARVSKGEIVLELIGSAVPLLAAERTALNILGHLSGIATTTRRWVDLAGSTQVLDTRKTFPGVRVFQRRAVAAGGGVNHRFDLAEFPLVKENHRFLFGSGGAEEVPEIIDRLRAEARGAPIEIEVEDEASFRMAVEAGADRILIDNQSPAEIARWIASAEASGFDVDRAGLEASGGITGETVAEYAASGVGRVSIGALTHTVRAFDVSLHVKWR